VIVQERRCLNGRCAARNERPRGKASAIDRHNVQPLGARSIVVVLELIEDRIVRTKGMTEEAMLGLSRCRCRVGPDVVRAFVVRHQYRTARDIRVVGMRQREEAHAQADKQQERDAGAPDPRRTAEHQLSLATRAGCVKPLADWQIGDCEKVVRLRIGRLTITGSPVPVAQALALPLTSVGRDFSRACR